MARKKYIAPIRNTERIGDSLIKINNNFENLKTALCEVETKFDSTVTTRTFFYYGPNSSVDPYSSMDNGKATFPSNATIARFCNDVNQLNLTVVSKRNDEAYVIYQKTGYISQTAIRNTSGYYPVVGPPRTIAQISRPASAPQTSWQYYNVQSPDRYNMYSPIFVIYKLVYNGRQYSAVSGFPKFSQAETSSTTNWANPVAWGQY
jgi:hypothetical protein